MHTAQPKETNGEFKDRAVQAMHDTRDRVVRASRDAAEHVDEQAHQNPWAFVGVAAFLSVILGFLLGRSTRR
jgi:ElaB/YqjD/DUF883 family membrane-anchored ribosome-binding protein